jgi:integrase
MPGKEFNPSEYKNKKQIYKAIPGYPGVSNIMIWSERRSKYLNKPCGYKYCAVKRVNGKQVTKSFENLNEAKKWQVNSEIEVSEQTDFLFKEIKQRYFEKKKSEVRIATYETSISKAKHLKYFDNYPMTAITPKVIDAWLIHVKSPSYTKGQHKYRIFYKHELSELSQIFSYYAEYICEDIAYANPVKKRHRKDCIINKEKHDEFKSKSKRKFLSDRDIRAFLNAFDERLLKRPVKEEPFKLLAHFQFFTGTRIGEAAAIHWEDICFDTKTILIHKSVTWKRSKNRKTFIANNTKTGVSRMVPLHNDLINPLKAWCLKSGRAKGLVFSYDGKTAFEYRPIVYRYDAVLKSIGSEWSGTHLFRHSFATDFLEKTGNHRALQGMLGHQSSRQTDHYAKMTGTTMEVGMKQYEEATAKAKSELKVIS